MRTFTLQAGTSDKFWSIDVAGTSVTVHYGRSGTKGQTKTQTFGTAAEATTHAEKLVASKVTKGYTETGNDGTGLTPVAPTVATAPPTAAPTRSAPIRTAPIRTAPIRTAPIRTAPIQSAPIQSAPIQDQDVPTPVGDLGVRLYRMEEAAFAWGRPFEDRTGDRPPFSAKAAAAWARSHILDEAVWESGMELIELPFDHLPVGDEAAWWAAWILSGKVTLNSSTSPYPLSGAQRISAVAKLLAGEKYRTHSHPATPDPFVDVAVSLLDTAPAELLRRRLQGRLAPLEVPALRALVLPRLTGEIHDDPAASRPPLDRIVRSALTRPPSEHLALLESADDDAFLHKRNATAYSHSTFLWSAAIAALVAVPTQDDAVRLWDRLGHHRHPHDHCRLSLNQFGLLLGLLGPDAADELTTLTCQAGSRDVAQVRAATLAARLHGPTAARLFARIARDSKAPDTGLNWLLEHPQATVAGQYTAKDRPVLTTVVRRLAADDPSVLDQQVSDPHLAATLAEVRDLVGVAELPEGAEPAWWSAAVAAEAAAPLPDPKSAGAIAIPTTLPAYLEPALLPPVLLDGARWRKDMVEHLLWSAARGAGDPTLTARPLVAAVRERVPARQLDALAGAVFDGWLGANAPSAGRAFFLAAGFLGTDGFVQQLLPLVREWPGQSQHQRAVLGLRVLAATGTKAALQGISGLAAKSKFKGVQEAAKVSMDTLAALQGLTADQLADRVVPDGGLDRRGQRVLDYGPRQFRLTLSPQGKPVLRDLDADGRPVGKPRTALPAPNSKDDADLAATTKAEFAVLRKQLTDLAKIQTTRLEQALITSRSWTGQEHRDLLAEHPVVASLIRPLVWRVRSTDGDNLVRVAEVGEYLTLDEDVVEIADDAVVTLAHPLDLDPAEIAGWHQQLTDHDLVAPLQQLDRPTFPLPAGTGTALPASALPQGTINPAGLVSTLERMGWRRSQPADGGVVHHLWLPFPAQDRAVILSVSDGLWTGMLADSGDQRITAAHVTTPAIAKDTWYFDPATQALPWTDLDPVAISESLRGLAVIAEKMT